MRLEDICSIIVKDTGFYITRKSFTTFYSSADDFYEDAATRYLYEKEVVGIESMNDRIHIILEDI